MYHLAPNEDRAKNHNSVMPPERDVGGKSA